MDVLIKARDLTVDFPIYEANARSFKSVMLRTATGGILSRESGRVMIRALDHLNFDIHEGDRIGLVGHNGSGKSTLLRVIAGVYEPVGGSVEVHGRIASMLNIWLGMNLDASGLENVYLRARVLGMRTREIEQVVDEICEFAELGDFIHMPLRTYSSGMQMRLAFAISTCVAADIVLMDEWLSVGDADFATKAQERLKKLLGRTKVLIVASHNESMISNSCNKILRLEHGKITEFRALA